MAESEWGTILEDLQHLCEEFPTGIVAIGGVAVWLHTKKYLDDQLLQGSHDADFYMSLQDYSQLTDLYEVTRNNRLGKSQIVQNGTDFDVYVEGQSRLAVSYAQAQRYSEEIGGIRCVCREHLLVLKGRAYEDRQGSAKGRKDAKDIGKLFVLLSEDANRKPEALSGLREEDLRLFGQVVGDPEVFNEMALQNRHWGKQLRDMAKRGLQYVEASQKHLYRAPYRAPSTVSRGRTKKPDIGI
ncbi:hypothetical protein AB4090_14975 [Acidithiobacillus sp. IBUN Pt1247-S3]|uniref:hypothetical protein n=1 Tax=Acidithiobacillus sp. IBUN Pt1247-S3 TaxID=3166642 RepID=UPI0034E564B9